MKKTLKYNSIRPLPYYMCENTSEEFALAKALRREFLPKIRTRLRGHHLNGFKHDFIVKFVAKHKKTHPCFLKTDISAFYPSIRHQDLVVGAQIAYRDLLSMQYVPHAFKKKYVPAMQAWCNSLPLTRGIPLGSPLSAILAPLMLVPLWLHIKRVYGVPFIVYMDDVLILTKDMAQANEILACIDNELAFRYDLHLNAQKTCAGRFARNSVDFCGWHFAGGYATVCEKKIEAFKERINMVTNNQHDKTMRGIIKQINRKIDGFGHYYKYGQVGKLYEQLDIVTRNRLRQRIARQFGAAAGTNRALYELGLRSLVEIHDRTQQDDAHTGLQRNPAPVPATGRTKVAYDNESAAPRQIELAEKTLLQIKESVRIQRKLIKIIGELSSSF